MTSLGIALALGCAALANVGMLCKHRGACQAPSVSFRRPWQSAVALFASKWWTIGFAVAAVAWILHVAAIALAPLSLVQAVIAGGIVLLAFPAQRYFGYELGRREWLGLGLAAAGLGFLALTVPQGADSSGYSISGLIAFEAAMIGAGFGLLASGAMGDGRGVHGVMLGASSGLLIGVANVAIKALTEAPVGPAMLLSPWSAVILLAGFGAFFSLARGMQLGEAIPVIATASVASNCSAILGGVMVFGDPIGSGGLEIAARAIAFAGVIAAAALMPGPGTREAPKTA